MNDGIGTVPADIVEGVDCALAVTGDDKVEASDFKIEPVS